MIARCAGILIPLFSIRSIDDFGRGEFGGLIPMARMALAMGHRLLQLLPIDEVPAGETSPYSALSVFALDPIYLSVRPLPGLKPGDCDAVRTKLRQRDEPANQLKLRMLKGQLLRESYGYFKSGADPVLRDRYTEFVEQQRGWLEDYALFRALKEEFDWTEWESWPAPLKNREPKALTNLCRALAEPIAMFKYVQFLAHQQWQGLREQLRRWGVLLGGDLAFSPGRESAEVWAHRELFDLRRAVGAPPDAFSAIGQRWGLPMPDWPRMRARNFEFLRCRVRHARELFDILRVDHVVGLYRTYGYSPGNDIGGEFDPPTERAQRAQGEEIMRIVLKEAGPMQIVAEDLGAIPHFVRDTLASLVIPGYKVMRWEKQHCADASADDRFVNPADYPPISLATTGTHDTDSLVEWWATIGEGERRLLMEAIHCATPPQCSQAILDEATLDSILEWVYASPAQLVVTPVQDLFGWDARINVPGTIADANWCWRLPFDLETFLEDPHNRARAATIRAMCEKTGRFALVGKERGRAGNV
ncbi:MAG: 4-alpha-glucanotransferase [Deltaproteobacteria bacterium]|nr:4-alpha-glucanotransferase [Deltaproteobacteria bacterium]